MGYLQALMKVTIEEEEFFIHESRHKGLKEDLSKPLASVANALSTLQCLAAFPADQMLLQKCSLRKLNT